MRAVVVYESMYGNTRRIAQAIAEGLHDINTVVMPVAEADAVLIGGADLIVVGGPTHAFGMSRPQTRAQAVENAKRAGSTLTVEPGAAGPGIREWLASADLDGASTAAFDTRVRATRGMRHAAPKIRRALRAHQCRMLSRPESVFVTKQNELLDGEIDRARDWGAALAEQMASRVQT
jgi:hypothetical protein